MEENGSKELSFRSILEEDLNWRDEEIRHLKNALNLFQKDNEKSCIRKSMILLIYAHCEGFVKSSLQAYLSYLNDLEIDGNAFIENLQLLGVEKKRKSLVNNSNNFSGFLNFFSEFKIIQQQKLRFDENCIDTESNLNFKVLKKNLEYVGLEESSFKEIENELDSLLNRRNNIAHGSDHDRVRQDDEEKWLIAFDKICNNLIRVISYAVINESYLKK